MAIEASGARLPALDIVRGVAVMGILLLNIVAFAMPPAAYVNPRAYGGWSGADLGVYLVNLLFFDGRMRALFSLLFGASLLLVSERAEAQGRSAASVHYRRMGWLLLFGLAHLWLVWFGDILAHYALVGMLAFPLRRLPPGRLIAAGILLILLSTLIFALVPLMIAQLQCCAPNAQAAIENGRRLTELARDIGVPDRAALVRDLALHRGDYLTLLAERFRQERASPLTLLPLIGPETLAYMLFGMAALKTGMLSGHWDRARYRRWLFCTWAVALPGYLALACYLWRSEFSMFSVALGPLALATPLRALMAVGWICVVLLLARPGGALTVRIAAAGRMAFTNYLVTSLICTTLFYGYGLGWYGHLSRWQLYPIVAVIWAGMLLWSAPWLRAFRFGPMEWLWRSLARGRLQPLRGPASG